MRADDNQKDPPGALLSKLGALVRLVREIGRARDAGDIYGPALSAIEEIVGVDRSSILLLDSHGVARFVAWRGISDAYRAAVEGHFPWALDEPAPEPILVRDVEQEPTFGPFLLVFRTEEIRSLAFIPLVYRERLVGKFMLYFHQPRDFEQEEIELVNAVAYLVAFAIERARLYASLEEADQRKDVFLATLAHELRNPLAPASAALTLLDARGGDEPTIRKALAILDRSVRQIVKLVDDLLDVSRVTRGVIRIEKQPIDLTSVVHHALIPVHNLIGGQGQELTLALEPLWLTADALRLEQVITNLVHNATKYTPHGGHIWVSTSAKGSGLEIRVRDDGIGVEPDVLPRLFDLFMQVDKSLARTRGGLGIGLTIVHRLVELHGGTVAATSEGKGRGADFVVWLPGRIEALSPVPLPSPPSAHGHQRRVLVVDDSEDAAFALAMLLREWGHEVATAGDGPSALAAVAQHHPDIVLLDIGLPGMSGYEVAARLRASGETHLKIVAVSGYGQPDDVARALAAGCDAHFPKPIDPATLNRMLAQPGA